MDNFWEDVQSSDYYLEILKRMGTHTSGAIACFGTTGTGKHPNYQIQRDGEVSTYIGMTHKSAADVAGAFDETKITRGYGYLEVLEMKERAKKRGF